MNNPLRSAGFNRPNGHRPAKYADRSQVVLPDDIQTEIPEKRWRVSEKRRKVSILTVTSDKYQRPLKLQQRCEEIICSIFAAV